MKHNGARWLEKCYVRESADKAIADAVESLKDVDFDTIAFRGASGALFAPIVAHLLKKEIFYVRKLDGSHSYADYEGFIESEKYIILDDFIGSGDTLRAIHKVMQKENPKASLVGFYFYHASSDRQGYLGPGNLEYEVITRQILHTVPQ